MSLSPIPCVDVIFIDPSHKRTLLFIRENEPGKGLPFSMGGRIHKNEHLRDATARKAKEELGLTIDSNKLKGPHVIEEFWPNSSFPGVSYHAITMFFFYSLNEADVSKITCDTQHAGHKWFDVDDPTLHEYIKERLSKIDANSLLD